MRALRRPLLAAVTAAAAATATALLVPAAPAVAAPSPTSEQSTTQGLRKAVSVEGITEHLRALQAIADANQENRVAGSQGYTSSGEYIEARLQKAGYTVTRDEFNFVYNADAVPLVLRLGTADLDDAAISMTFSPNGDVTARLFTVSALGCEAGDFAGLPAGAIAVVSRGTCSFAAKAANAAAAGAAAVVIYNNTTGTLAGTLGRVPTPRIPVVGVPTAVGQRLVAANGQAARVRVQRVNETRTTFNLIADLASPRAEDDVVLVGAHLDSVPAGPGINDNGSGSATILEIAEAMANGKGKLQNTVRFAFWSAEEFGLLGSRAYVDELKAQRPAELARIALNLNFDMVGSPNYGRFIYDGDNTAFPVGPGAAEGPDGSGEIERVFQDLFASQGLASAATPFSGRSDYGPFITEGIPAGGLFTGAEGLKSAAQEKAFGGKAGLAFDPCYHQLCDNLTGESRGIRDYSGFGRLLGNVNLTGLDEMSDAAAHAVGVFSRRDLTKAPLVDPTPRKEGLEGINEGGGLHAEHDDHDTVAS